MRKNVLLNYIYNVLYQIVIMALPLITTPYVSRVLGAANIGSYSYTQSITYYFILFGSFGLNLYGQREIAYVQDNKEKRSKVFLELFIIRIITHTISLIIFCSTFIYHEKYAFLFRIQILDIISSCLDISWFFQGIEDFKKPTIRNIFIRVFAVFCIFMFVKTPDDIYIYTICYSASLLLGNVLMLVYLPKLINKTKFQTINLKKHMKPCVILFLPQIATSIYNVLDKTMIGTITKIEEEVAYYEQAQKIVKLAMSFLTSIGTVMLPRIAYVFAKQERDDMEKYIMNSFRYAFFLGVPFTLGIIAVAQGMVPWFFGQGYERVIPNILVISPIILIVGLSNVIGIQYLLPTKRQNDYLISVLCGSIINVVLNVILIPRYLSVGAALATVVAEATVLLIQIICIRKDFSNLSIVDKIFKYVIAGIIMYLVLCIFVKDYQPSILLTLSQTIVGGIVYIGTLFLMKDELIIKVFRKIWRNKNV